MNYSRKKSGRAYSQMICSAARAIFVLAAAFWFCSSTDISVSKDDITANDGAVTVVTEAFDDTEISESPDILSDTSEAASSDIEPVEADCSASDDGFINPAEGVLTSGFGARWGRNHNGIDIGADSGSEILAAENGTVTCAGIVSGYGNYVAIDHGNGFETAYAHCSSIVADEGEHVAKGQVIAYVGSTGNSTGPHLHFEIKLNGEYLNPLEYVVY